MDKLVMENNFAEKNSSPMIIWEMVRKRWQTIFHTYC